LVVAVVVVVVVVVVVGSISFPQLENIKLEAFTQAWGCPAACWSTTGKLQ